VASLAKLWAQTIRKEFRMNMKSKSCKCVC
jgi:hypothetical protein